MSSAGAVGSGGGGGATLPVLALRPMAWRARSKLGSGIDGARLRVVGGGAIVVTGKLGEWGDEEEEEDKIEVAEGESLEEVLSPEKYKALMSITFGRAIKVVDFWNSKGIDVTKKKFSGRYNINNVKELPKIMKWFADNPTELEALKTLNYDFLKYAEIQSTYLINKNK